MAVGDLVSDAVVGVRAVVIEVDLTVLVVPPAAVSVLSDAGVSQTDLAVLDIVISVVALEINIQEAGVVECDRTVTDIPVTVLVGNDAFVLEVDTAVLEIVPAVIVFRKTGELEVDLTLLDSPPAVFIAGVVSLDLSGRDIVSIPVPVLFVITNVELRRRSCSVRPGAVDESDQSDRDEHGCTQKDCQNFTSVHRDVPRHCHISFPFDFCSVKVCLYLEEYYIFF